MCQALYQGHLTPPHALSQVNKPRFREFCDLPNFIQLVNAGDLNPGVSPKSKLLPSRNKVRDHGNDMEMGGTLGKQVVLTSCLSGEECRSQAATLVE